MQKYFVAILYLILISCASQGYPGGGPIDNEGPIILNISPSSGNLSKDQPIVIEFNENINPNSASSAIMINQKENFKLRIYKNKIIINPDVLWDDIVELYISRKIQDYQDNLMNTSITKIYTTSSQNIHNGTISGKLLNIERERFYDIGLYQIVNDSTNFIKKIEADIDGNFKFINIGNGEYRLAAIEGILNDFDYDYKLNRYGMQSKEISINDQIFNQNINIVIDNPIPRLNIVSTKIINPNFIKLTLSDESEKSVYIADNLDVDRYQIGDSIKLNIEHKNRLESYLMPEFNFIANFTQDTLAPSIDNFYFDKNLYVKFSEPIKLLSPDIFFQDKKPLKHELINPFEVKVLLKNNIKEGISIIENKISDYEGNKISVVLNVETEVTEKKQEKYGSIKGVVKYSNIDDIIVRMTHIETNNQYFEHLSNNGDFIFKELIPGKYILDSYEFKGSNKDVYFSGLWNPYKKAAQFAVYPDSIDVRAHWEIEGIELKYD